jgi:hypothetical protein
MHIILTIDPDNKLKSISDLNVASLVEIAQLRSENDQMKSRLADLERLHATHEQRVDNERRHAGEQYNALRERYDREVQARKELEDRIKSMDSRQPRRPRSQNRGRGKSQGALHVNGYWNGNSKPSNNSNPPNLPSLNTTPPNMQRRKSFLPVPSRPSTPISTPLRHSPPGSSSCTLVSSTYSTFSRASVKTNDSASSVASSAVRDQSPESPSTTTASRPRISRPPIPTWDERNPEGPEEELRTPQAAKPSWANLVARPGPKV